LDGDDEILVLVFDEVLGVGEGVLGIEFSAALNEHLKGFYRWWALFSFSPFHRRFIVAQTPIHARCLVPSLPPKFS